jgi:hypothetical protein
VITVRPENAALTAPDGPEANRVPGRVAFASYLGNTLRYDVETDGGPVLKVDIRDPWHHDPLALGARVVVSFPASVTLAVSDDA